MLLKILSSATGRINSAVLRGNRYRATDLATLAAAGTEDSDYLIDITCQIAYWMLLRGKPHVGSKEERQAAREQNDELLEVLKTGDEIFNIETTRDAGQPKIDTVTRSQAASTMSLVVDAARGRFFPRRRSYRNR